MILEVFIPILLQTVYITTDDKEVGKRWGEGGEREREGLRKRKLIDVTLSPAPIPVSTLLFITTF